MKVYVHRTSGDFKHGEVREYASLEKCVDTLLVTEDYHGCKPELVISKPSAYTIGAVQGSDYIVEVYDDYRE